MKVKMTRIFGYHLAPADADRFVDKMLEAEPDAHVIVLDGPMWTPEVEEIMNAVTHGKMTHAQAAAMGMETQDGFYSQILKRLEGTKKILMFADIPARAGANAPPPEVTVRYHKALQEFQNIDQILHQRPFSYEEALRESERIAKEFAAANAAREEYIIENFPKRLTRVAKEHPALKMKSPLNLVEFYGLAHTTGIGKEMRKLHPQAEPYRLSAKPAVNDYMGEYVRVLSMKKAPAPELAHKALASFLIEDLILSQDLMRKEDARTYPIMLRKLIDSLSMDDLKKFYELYMVKRNTAAAAELISSRLKIT